MSILPVQNDLVKDAWIITASKMTMCYLVVTKPVNLKILRNY